MDANKVVTILQTLSFIPINIALLTESGLGKKVNAIRKSQAFKHSSTITESATALIAKWKQSVTAEKKALKRSKKQKAKTPSMSPPLNGSNDINNDKQPSVDTEDTDNGFVR